MGPLVAFTMAGLLFVYTRSSIRAAKRNAERHRVADGGQISWYNESQRRHGALEKPKEQESLAQPVIGSQKEAGKLAAKSSRRSENGKNVIARKGTQGNNDG